LDNHAVAEFLVSFTPLALKEMQSFTAPGKQMLPEVKSLVKVKHNAPQELVRRRQENGCQPRATPTIHVIPRHGRAGLWLNASGTSAKNRAE